MAFNGEVRQFNRNQRPHEELRPFNWRPARGGNDHMRIFGGWWSQVPNRSPMLELALHSKVQLARENNKRCVDYVDEEIKAFLLKPNKVGYESITLADCIDN